MPDVELEGLLGVLNGRIDARLTLIAGEQEALEVLATRVRMLEVRLDAVAEQAAGDPDVKLQTDLAVAYRTIEFLDAAFPDLAGPADAEVSAEVVPTLPGPAVIPCPDCGEQVTPEDWGEHIAVHDAADELPEGLDEPEIVVVAEIVPADA